MTVQISQEIVDQIILGYDKLEYHDLDLYYGTTSDNSSLAKTVLGKKYFAPEETCLFDMWVRIAWGAAQCEEEDKRIFWANKFFGILADFKFIPGGRINFGLGRTDINVSLSNCYVIPIQEDSLEGIYKCLYEEAMTYKSGGGCGHDLDILRPEGSAIVGTGGNSCGSVGFMNLFSVSTDTVQQQSRRGANMQTLSVNHPDIEKFIAIKNDAYWVQDYFKKISKLFPPAAKALKKINEDFVDKRRMVQQSNISVKIRDSFMNAVVADKDYDLTWDGKVFKTISAKILWNKLNYNAWRSGEPGVIFWDRMVETNNLEYCSPIVSTNPCIVGYTLIAVADGRNAVSIKQLMEEGKDVPVYSTNLETGQVEIKMAHNARLTGKNEVVWKLTLDDGSTLIATPNHKVLLKSLEYVELKDLKAGDSIFPYNLSECKVVSVEFFGREDVYNISVDDNHNYHIVTSHNNDFTQKTGICIKNCSEIPLGAYGNCLLGHVNLARFVDKESSVFLEDEFKQTVEIAQRFLDNICTLGADKHPLKEQTEHALNERRIGLGVTGLGDMLILLKEKYGSSDSICVVEKISQIFRDTTYVASCNLAKERGAFPWYNEEGFFKSKFAQRLPSYIQKMIRENGIRNGMLLTCAPVGTGSIISEVSSGIEPIFRTFFIRKVKDNNGNFDKYVIYHPLIKELYIDKGLEVPDWVVDSSQIAPSDRVLMQATIQKYIDNSISSTVNLPEDATVEQVEEVYMQAWKMGCKGITVYREGCREGVLISDTTADELSKELDLDEVEHDENNKRRYTLKRPKKLDGETYKIRTDTGSNDGLINCYYTVNFFPNSDVPYELLITEPPGNKDMKDFLMLELATRCTSMMLRHRIPLKFIVSQFEKIKNQYIYSVPLNIAKVLRNYLTEEEMVELDDGGLEFCETEDKVVEPQSMTITSTTPVVIKANNLEEKRGVRCKECGGQIKFENGCYICLDCGNGKCS